MKFSIAGTGNVAHHFATMWRQQGHTLLQVYARNAQAGNSFANSFGAAYIDSATLFSEENDLVLLAVKDEAIAEVAASVPHTLFVIHPSGSTPLHAMPQQRKGVVWSIQTMTANKTLDYSKIPFLIEASNKEDETMLLQLFQAVSPNVHVANTEQRTRVHMAAVFANNFTNQMYDIAEGILKEMNLPLDILLPSIEEQVNKIKVMSPRAAQTGPAMRNDTTTLHKHLELLKQQPELIELYRNITNRILQQYHGKKL
jgi:predicted short-subunit dehydrogenase-like oxidoreductase (DUF2520 family)